MGLAVYREQVIGLSMRAHYIPPRNELNQRNLRIRSENSEGISSCSPGFPALSQRRVQPSSESRSNTSPKQTHEAQKRAGYPGNNATTEHEKPCRGFVSGWLRKCAQRPSPCLGTIPPPRRNSFRVDHQIPALPKVAPLFLHFGRPSSIRNVHLSDAVLCNRRLERAVQPWAI